MTGQPAVELSLPFSVASHAKAHLKIDGDESVLGFNVAVALYAVDLIPSHVGLVAKKNVVRRKENSNPGDRFLRLKVPEFFQNLRVLSNDVLMAEEAFLDRRYSRIL